MKIRQINIHNFGQFHNKSLSFSPGLNVIYGGNESGKTTLHAFLLSMMFGLEKTKGADAKSDRYSLYEPWNGAGFYSGEMDFDVGEQSFHIERDFCQTKTALYRQEGSEKFPEEYVAPPILFGGWTRERYESTFCIPQTGMAPEKELIAFAHKNQASGESGEGRNLRVHQSLSHLEERKKETEQELYAEMEKRSYQIEKLQVERELLEENIEELKETMLDEEMADEDISTQTGGFSKLAMVLGATFLRKKDGVVPSKEQKGVKARILEEIREGELRLFNVLEAQTELEARTDREVELRQYLSAYDIASRAIRALSGDGHEDFAERVTRRASEILKDLTEGRYDGVSVNEKMEVSVSSQNRTFRPEQLSEGTLEQIRFSLRMGLGEVFTKDEPMPFLMDEPFSHYDESRIRQALRWLSKQDRQMFLFTCQERKMQYLEEMKISHEQIRLEGN